MFCVKCGYELPEDAAFCIMCGHKVESNAKAKGASDVFDSPFENTSTAASETESDERFEPESVLDGDKHSDFEAETDSKKHPDVESEGEVIDTEVIEPEVSNTGHVNSGYENTHVNTGHVNTEPPIDVTLPDGFEQEKKKGRGILVAIVVVITVAIIAIAAVAIAAIESETRSGSGDLNLDEHDGPTEPSKPNTTNSVPDYATEGRVIFVDSNNIMYLVDGYHFYAALLNSSNEIEGVILRETLDTKIYSVAVCDDEIFLATADGIFKYEDSYFGLDVYNNGNDYGDIFDDDDGYNLDEILKDDDRDDKYDKHDEDDIDDGDDIDDRDGKYDMDDRDESRPELIVNTEVEKGFEIFDDYVYYISESNLCRISEDGGRTETVYEGVCDFQIADYTIYLTNKNSELLSIDIGTDVRGDFDAETLIDLDVDDPMIAIGSDEIFYKGSSDSEIGTYTISEETLYTLNLSDDPKKEGPIYAYGHFLIYESDVVSKDSENDSFDCSYTVVNMDDSSSEILSTSDTSLLNKPYGAVFAGGVLFEYDKSKQTVLFLDIEDLYCESFYAGELMEDEGRDGADSIKTPE